MNTVKDEQVHINGPVKVVLVNMRRSRGIFKLLDSERQAMEIFRAPGTKLYNQAIHWFIFRNS